MRLLPLPEGGHDSTPKKMIGIIGVATDDLLHSGTEVHWSKMESIKSRYKLGKFAKGDGRFAGKEIKHFKDGRIKLMQPLYVSEKVHEIPLSKERKRERMSRCDDREINALRTLIGSLAWLSKESRPDLAGRTAILQQSMPHPSIQDIVEANILAQEAHRQPELGITFFPIPMEQLRIGTVSDASWGNVYDRSSWTEEEGDFWVETETQWIRHHVHPRRILFHPGSTRGDGPDLHWLQPERYTYVDGHGERCDEWNSKDALRGILGEPWTGRTVFMKSEKMEPKISDRYLQQARTSAAVKRASSCSSTMRGWRPSRSYIGYLSSTGRATS